jgi:hypothetical protein
VIRIISTVALGLCVVTAGVASAKGGDIDADDKAMVQKVRSIGLAIGNAYVCTQQDKRQAFKKDTLELFDLIIKDVGSDRAFVYATSIGYGASVSKDNLDCPSLLKRWDEMREDFELGGGKG